MSEQNKKTLRIVVIALMAAIVFVTSKFLSIPLPIPSIGGTPARLHLGNVFCILSGLLFGAWSGGLSAGLGSAMMDLFDPVYLTSTPTTLINKFVMGFLAGKIAHRRGHAGESFQWNLIGAITGQVAYIILYLIKTFLDGLIIGNDMGTILAALTVKGGTSLINGGIAVAVAVPLSLVLRKGLKGTAVFRTMTAKPVK